MGHEGTRFSLPRAAQIPPQREGKGESEERDLLRRLGGFGLSPVSSVEPSPEPSANSLAPPNTKPKVVSRPGRLLAGLVILAIVVPIGVYTLVPGVKDGKFAQTSRSPATGLTARLVRVLAEPTSATPPATATGGDEIHPSPASASDHTAQLQFACASLLALTIVAGSFVAGTHAGLDYNTFPLMDGQLVPDDYARLTPFLRNLTENIAAVQFDHRLLATLTALTVALTVIVGFAAPTQLDVKLPLFGLGLTAAVQYGLGVATLLLVVPVGLAAAHQANAVLLLTAAIVLLHALRRPPPAATAA